jgi:hypothetical protein
LFEIRVIGVRMEPGDIAAEMERVSISIASSKNGTSAEFQSGGNGTKWTNEQLLFHMLFGYLWSTTCCRWSK